MAKAKQTGVELQLTAEEAKALKEMLSNERWPVADMNAVRALNSIWDALDTIGED